MIVRILHEGQLDVPEEAVAELNHLDEHLIAAVEQGDEPSFEQALADLQAELRSVGRPVPPDHLGPSELILPGAGATLEEVRHLLAEEGLIG